MVKWHCSGIKGILTLSHLASLTKSTEKLFFSFILWQVKPKGVSGLIEIENPNRVTSKTKKASELTNDDSSTVQLSRRERFVIKHNSFIFQGVYFLLGDTNIMNFKIS